MLHQADGLPKFRKRLICLSPEAEQQLAYLSAEMGTNHSQTIRDALALLMRRYQEAWKKAEANGKPPVSAEGQEIMPQAREA